MSRLPDLAKTPRSGPSDRLPDAPPARPLPRVRSGRWSRRKLLAAALGGAGTAVLGGIGYAVGVEPVWPRIVRLPLPLSGLGPEFQGARLVQISDLHVGPSVPLAYLQKWVDWVSAQQADFVLVTGDSIHYSNAPGTPVAARLLRRLRAREAVLVSLGNHEWAASGPGRGNAGLAQRAANAMETEGLKVLRNQTASFRRGRSELHVVGLDDCWGDNYRPDNAFRQIGSAAPTIIMSHNPDTFPDLLQGPGDWVLTGHTHGGQVSIPFFGPPQLPVRHRQFAAGAYSLGGKTLYVNRGLGWARRVRFNCRPEVTVFTLESSSAPIGRALTGRPEAPGPARL